MLSLVRCFCYDLKDKAKSLKLGTGNLANLDTEGEVIRIETRQRHKNNFSLNCDVPLIVPFD